MCKPSLRFPEFNNEWKRITLSCVGSGFEYGLNSPACKYNGRDKYIRITDIDSFGGYLNENVVSPLNCSEIDKKRYLVCENDILFARTSTSVGETYLYQKKDGCLYFAGFLIRVNINSNEANAGFIYQNTKTQKYRNWVKTTSTRTSQPGINANEYKKYRFYLPDISEQNKISNFLSLLDERIRIERKIINILEKI